MDKNIKAVIWVRPNCERVLCISCGPYDIEAKQGLASIGVKLVWKCECEEIGVSLFLTSGGPGVLLKELDRAGCEDTTLRGLRYHGP